MSRENHIFKKIRTGSQAELLAEALIERPASSEVRRVGTAGALAAAGMGLRISCEGCGTSEEVAPDEVVRRFGAATPLARIRPACGRERCAQSVVPFSA